MLAIPAKKPQLVRTAFTPSRRMGGKSSSNNAAPPILPTQFCTLCCSPGDIEVYTAIRRWAIQTIYPLAFRVCCPPAMG